MSFIRWTLALALLAVFSGWWIFFRVKVDPKEDRVYRFLITKEYPFSLWGDQNSEQDIISSWVLFYQYPSRNFFLLEIDDATQVKINEGFYAPINQNRSFLKKNLAEYYGLEKFDFEIHFTEQQQLDFLSENGGSSFFNLYSSALPLGEVYISEVNYKEYLAGIDNPYLRKITALGFWYNLFMLFQETLPHRSYADLFLKAVYGLFSGNLNYPTLAALASPLVFPKDTGSGYDLIKNRINFKMDKNSIENVSSSQTPILVPFEGGDYDRAKLEKEMRELVSEERQEDQSITAQIKNATRISRLAARAAGFFRLKGINIIEYLGFGKTLENSVVLDFTHNPRKRDYVRSVTKIDKFYYLFNYRENYDFGIYLGEDLYLLSDQKNR